MSILNKEPWKTIFRILLFVFIYTVILYGIVESYYSGSVIGIVIECVGCILAYGVILVGWHKKKHALKVKKETGEDYADYLSMSDEEANEKASNLIKVLKILLVYFIVTAIVSLITLDLLYLYIFLYVSSAVINFTLLSGEAQKTIINNVKVGVIRGLIYAFTVLPLIMLVTVLIFKKYV